MKDTLKIAQKLALEFSEESDIPSRFKKEVKKKYNEDSLIEQRFQKNVMNWKQVVDTMLQKIGSEKTSRFILLKPIIEPNLQSVVYAQDFIDFNNYFILRRDVEQCNDNAHTRLHRCPLFVHLNKTCKKQPHFCPLDLKNVKI